MKKKMLATIMALSMGLSMMSMAALERTTMANTKVVMPSHVKTNQQHPICGNKYGKKVCMKNSKANKVKVFFCSLR